jgi:hypothetical protein
MRRVASDGSGAGGQAGDEFLALGPGPEAGFGVQVADGAGVEQFGAPVAGQLDSVVVGAVRVVAADDGDGGERQAGAGCLVVGWWGDQEGAGDGAGVFGGPEAGGHAAGAVGDEDGRLVGGADDGVQGGDAVFGDVRRAGRFGGPFVVAVGAGPLPGPVVGEGYGAAGDEQESGHPRERNGKRECLPVVRVSNIVGPCLI